MCYVIPSARRTPQTQTDADADADEDTLVTRTHITYRITSIIITLDSVMLPNTSYYCTVYYLILEQNYQFLTSMTLNKLQR